MIIKNAKGIFAQNVTKSETLSYSFIIDNLFIRIYDHLSK